MIGEVCVYSGKLFVPYSKRRLLFVKAYRYNGSEEQVFQELFESSVHLKEDSAIKKCRITTAGNNTSGIVSLYAIVLFENNKVNIFTCSECLDSLKMKEVEDMSTNIFCASIGDIWLADGPLLAVVSDVSLRLHLASEVRDYDMQQILRVPVSCFKILYVALVGHRNTREGSVTLYIVVVSFSSVNPCKEQIQILVYFQSALGDVFNAGLQHISTDLFFSLDFSSVITTVHLNISHPSLAEVLKKKSLEEALLHLSWRDNRTILCTEKQCSVFYRSFLQYSCDIPYSDVTCIFPVPSYLQESQKENIILQSSSIGVCWLRVDKQMKTMKCAQEWKDAITAVVGCLLGNGVNHLLLLRSLDPDTWLNECFISDINMHFAGNTDFRGTATSSDYLKNAVIALQKRVMTGKAEVNELQYKISEKQAVINEILRNLIGHNSAIDSFIIGESGSSLFQAPLVDILPSNDSVSLKIRNKMELKVAMRITGHWKTVVRENFIFGWTLENVSDRCVTNPKVYLMIENEYQKSVQKVFVHSSEEMPSQPKLSDTVSEQVVFKSGDKLSLVLCFALPKFLSDTVNTFFLISWCECKIQEAHKFDFLSTVHEHPSQQITGKSTISVTDLFEKYPLQGLSVVQQLMSFRVLQQQTILSISCMNSDLSQFEGILMSNAAQNAPVVINHLNMKFLIFNNLQSCLYGVNMSWKQLDRTSIETTVYSRYVKEITLLTQWIYSVMPGDTCILPRSMNMKDTLEIRNKILVSMKNEVDLVREFLASPDCTSRASKKQIEKGQSRPSDTTVNHSPDRIILSKEKFYKMREELLKNELLTDSIIKKLHI